MICSITDQAFTLALVGENANKSIDYYFSSEITMVSGIWMSFFDTEEAHVVMLAYFA